MVLEQPFQTEIFKWTQSPIPWELVGYFYMSRSALKLRFRILSTDFTQSQDFGAKFLIFFSKSGVLGSLGDTPHVYKIQKFS
jgi:hypothetical protein